MHPKITEIKNLTLLAALCIPLLPIWFGRGAVMRIQEHPVKANLSKISKQNFKRFKRIMYNDSMPLDICLEVWKIIIIGVLELSQIVSLIDLQPSLNYTLNILDLSITIYPVEALLMSGNAKRQWMIAFENYPYQSLTIKELNTLTGFMELHKLQFKSITFNTFGQSCNHNSQLDYPDELIGRVSTLSENVKCIYDRLFGFRSYGIWPVLLTSIRVPINIDITGIASLEKLTEVVLVAPFLLSELASTRFGIILESVIGLQSLTVEFASLFSPTASNVAHVCILFGNLVQQYTKTKIEFNCTKPTGVSELAASSRSIYSHIYESLLPIEHLFKSVDLPLRNRTISYLETFTRLTELWINNTALYQGGLILFKSASLISLTVDGSLTDHLLRFSFKSLRNLQNLRIDAGFIHCMTFDTLPTTIRKLHLNKCSVRGPLRLPGSLRVLKLWHTCPRINIEEVNTNLQKIKLSIRWSNIDELERVGFTRILGETSAILDSLRLEPENMVPSYANIVRVPSYEDRVYSFSVEYAEGIQNFNAFRYIQRMQYVNISNSSDSVPYPIALSNLVLVCMKSFQRKDKVLKDGVKWKVDKQVTYEEQLKDSFESICPYLDYNIVNTESKMVFPRLYTSYCDPSVTAI